MAEGRRTRLSLVTPTGVAWAALPCANSSVPDCVVLVGTTGGVPAGALGEFTVIVRDCANLPVPNAAVVVDLSLCTDLHFCPDQADPGAIVDCANGWVRKFTDANGSVRFTLLGGSNGAGNATELHNVGRIFANGTLLRSPTISAFDLDGQLGVGGNDLSAFLGDFSTGTPFGRVEYDCNGSTGGNDLSIWLAAFGSGTMIESCAATCP